MSQHVWNIQETSDSIGPVSVVRAYFEQRDVRRCLAHASSARRLKAACDVGCGYGRLTMVLAEFAAKVVGFEREPALVAEAKRILPALEFQTVESLARLPSAFGSFDFAMTFTVLQHMNDIEARDAIEEVKRIVDDGFILIVEETDPALGAEFKSDHQGGLTKGRTHEVYEAWMEPYRLILQFPREIEPGYPRADVGTYMLFGR